MIKVKFLGRPGPAGKGIPAGGIDGQVPVKDGITDYAMRWLTLSKSAVGLGNADNTADTAKPVSSAQAAADAAVLAAAIQRGNHTGSQAISTVSGLQTALDGKAALAHGHAISDVTGLQAALDAKAPLASPALTGAPTAPTAASGTNTTQIATTQFVKSEIDAAVMATYQTHADLAAVLAATTEGAYVVVLADETHAGVPWVWQKSGGVWISRAPHGRQSRPIVPWLPNPAHVPYDGFEVIVQSRSAVYEARCVGGTWYNKATGAAIPLWWVPPGSTAVVNFADSRFHWNGAQKVIGDLTATTVGGQSCYRLDSYDFGISVSTGATVIVEFTPSETGCYTVNGEHIWSMTKTDGSGGRTELFFTNSTAVATIYHARYGTGAISVNYTVPSSFSGQGHVKSPGRGRRRIGISLPPSGSGRPVLRGQNGYPIATDQTLPDGTGWAVNRMGFGYRAIHGSEDSPWLDAASRGTLIVRVFNYDMTQAEFEAAMDFSEEGLRGKYAMADSFGVTIDYGTSGKDIVGHMMHAQRNEGYCPWVLDQFGSTGWDHSGGSSPTFLERLAMRSDRYKKYDLLVLEGVWETPPGGTYDASIINGLKAAQAFFTHDNYCITDNLFASGYTSGLRAPFLAAKPAIQAYVGGDRFFDPYPTLVALATSPGDDVAVAQGNLPPSITSDGLHLNYTVGAPAYGTAWLAHLTTQGLLATGRWWAA